MYFQLEITQKELFLTDCKKSYVSSSSCFQNLSYEKNNQKQDVFVKHYAPLPTCDIHKYLHLEVIGKGCHVKGSHKIKVRSRSTILASPGSAHGKIQSIKWNLDMSNITEKVT